MTRCENGTCARQLAGGSFVVDPSGTVVIADEAGHDELEAQGDELRAYLLAAIRGDRRFFDVYMAHGSEQLYLIVAKTAADPVQQRVLRAASAWKLTPRQREVLVAVVQGHSNVRIATELAVVERTVEAHVTAILDRARCMSRAELITTVLTATG
jgi:DNA-binding NarL/FixJ family response regulator